MQVVEGVGNLAASLGPNECFEPQHFPDDTLKFAPGDVGGWGLHRFRSLTPREETGFSYGLKPTAPPKQVHPPQLYQANQQPHNPLPVPTAIYISKRDQH